MGKEKKHRRHRTRAKAHGVREDALVTAWLAMNPNDEATIGREALLDAIYFIGLNPSLKLFGELVADDARARFTFNDFKDIARKIPPTTPDDMIKAFQAIDVDKDAHLSHRELVQALMKDGEPLTKEQVLEVLAFDTDDSGAIDYQEFVEMCESMAAQMTSLCPPPEAAVKGTGKEATLGTNKTKRKSNSEASTRRGSSRDVTAKKGRPSLASSSRPPTGRHSHLNEEIPKPSQLKTWEKHPLTLRMPRKLSAIPSTQLTHFTIREATTLFITCKETPSLLSPTLKHPGDLLCFLAKKKGKGGSGDELSAAEYALMESSKQHKNVFVIKYDAEPGDYVVVCVSVEGISERKENAGSIPALVHDSELTQTAKDALTETFNSVDCTGKGRVGHEEYNALMMLTDGEKCADDVWEFILESFSSEEDELTLNGFLQCYQQMIDEETTDETMYEHFVELGYNRQMELDETILIACNVYAKTFKALEGLKITPFDEALVESLLQQ